MNLLFYIALIPSLLLNSYTNAATSENFAPLESKPSTVTIKKEGGKWQLFRNGKAYYVKGVGGWQLLELLAQSGGNSFRTWGVDKETKGLLDKAAKLGLSVNVGLWVGHERHGFNYNDAVAVQKQLERFTANVKSLKDHPALLMWGIGNEVQTNYKNSKVWNAINDISKMIHKIDGKHPTSTVLSWPSARVMKDIQERAPDIDIIGLNSYAGLEASLTEAQKHGWKGPTIVCEYGPNGHWEVGKTSWGAYLEADSTIKSKLYSQRSSAIMKNSDCLGSYAFLWGEKQERTKTWYGLIFDKKHVTAGADELAKAWSGQYPKNRAPSIQSLTVNGQTANANVKLAADKTYTAQLKAKDDTSELKYVWTLLHESTATSGGGDAEGIPPTVEGAILKAEKDGSVEFKTPKRKGQYRLFVYAYDTAGKMAHANFPILVN